MKHRVAWLLLAALAAGCSRQPKEAAAVAPAKAPDAIQVQTAKAETRRVDRAIAVTGSLHPDETVTVSFEVAGRVARIPVDFGHQVRKGQIIAELDKQEFNLQLERSRAALAQALARLGLDPTQENVTPDTTPAIRQAQAQLEDVRFRFDSAAKLYKTGDISQERYNELEKMYRARQAAVDASRDELRTALASIRGLRAEVGLAQKRLTDTTVRAPFDGAVSARLVAPGQYIKDNTPIVTLVKTNPLRLRLEAPESAAGEVRVGTSLTFTTDSIPNKQFHAVVRELNPGLDARSRLLTAEARLVESDARLRPGMFVQVELVVSRNAPVLMVPREAVHSVAGLTKVFVIRNDRAVDLRVPPGIVRDGWVEIPSDQLKPGEPVAVSNLSMLVDGAPVQAR
jgi:RND family efflux transporter MFP subunit